LNDQYSFYGGGRKLRRISWWWKKVEKDLMVVEES